MSPVYASTYTCECGATWDWWDFDGYRPGWTLTDEGHPILDCPSCERDLPEQPEEAAA